jgi:23S rRNA pseudouridine2457 synthase
MKNITEMFYFCVMSQEPPRYFIIYKPYKMVSQFVSPHSHPLLGDLNFNFPAGTNAVGRLDHDSEGLLILTTDKMLAKELLLPEKKHTRSYIAQVERIVDESSVSTIMSGLEIIIKRRGIYKTLPCEVKIIPKPANLADRAYPFREFIPHSWLEFVLTEGKNRQIRKMCSAVRHDCKRLIRTKIENLELGNMQPGEVREIDRARLFELLKLENNTSKLPTSTNASKMQ